MSRLPESLRAHVLDPRNVGEPDGADLRGEARNAACRDHLVIYLGLDGDTIDRAGFRAAGCPAALGYGSAVTELLPGLTADGDLVAQLDARLVEVHGDPAPLHRHAVALVREALDDALAHRG